MFTKQQLAQVETELNAALAHADELARVDNLRYQIAAWLPTETMQMETTKTQRRIAQLIRLWNYMLNENCKHVCGGNNE